MRIIVDGIPIPYHEGDSLLIALLRAEMPPTVGGCLCLAGDCGHCLATVDGVSYVRTCQTVAQAGQMVARDHAHGRPPLPQTMQHGRAIPTRHEFCDVVVIGQGEAGRTAAATARAAGQIVATIEAEQGEEAIGVYMGPLVIARTAVGLRHIHPSQEIIVATGAAEIQPVVPGNDLAGIVTARAAEKLARAGLQLGRLVAIGTPPQGVEATQVAGELVRFEGVSGRVTAVVVREEDGRETTHPCDTVSVGLGLNPCNNLWRMGRGLPIPLQIVGDAALEGDIPPCPVAGIVCTCSNVTVEQLQSVWERGFHELELVKRATLAGTGTCQGAMCIPHLRSFLADRGQVLQPPFTARPVSRQLTMGEIAAGEHHHPTPRTMLDGEHRRLGAQMDRIGGWWRPWHYGDPLAEYWAVREAVSLGDVSTLGKMIVSGPDALELLERLYPTKVATIKPGRARYVLLLNERGYVLDDGLIACEDESQTRYSLTFTSGGSTTAELWVRDWADTWRLDVRLLNQTLALGAINVTGPLANELLRRAGWEPTLKYMEHGRAEVAGVPCHIYRLSFTGELSYELHHPSGQGVKLWRALLELGRDLGIRPHGLKALLQLRLEKGHILVGQDTDFDSTPRRIAHEWAVRLDKPDFVGKQALLRTNKLPLNRQLSSWEMAAPAPIEGATIWQGDEYLGYVTSCTFSPVLGKVVLLGWVAVQPDGSLPEMVTIDGRPATPSPTPFYDPQGERTRA